MMASNDNFGMTPATSKVVLLLIATGAVFIGSVIYALIGAILGGLPALYFHSWVYVGYGALAGAVFALTQFAWGFAKGFVTARILNKAGVT